MLFPERRLGFVGNDLFDYFLNDSLFNVNVNTTKKMCTDIIEKEDGYELAIEVPGFDKDDLQIELKKGYLTIIAEHSVKDEQKNDAGRMIRQERSYASSKRSFYVGNAVTKEDIKAKYEKGILNISVPKKEAKKIENKQMIEIE